MNWSLEQSAIVDTVSKRSALTVLKSEVVETKEVKKSLISPEQCMRLEWSYHLPAGMILHSVGNIIRHAGREWLCTFVNGSGATFIDRNNNLEHLVNCCEGSEIIRVDTLANFLLTSKRAHEVVEENTNQGAQKENSMPKSKNAKKEKTTKISGRALSSDGKGKMEFISDAMTAKGNGRTTRSALIKLVCEEFPGSSEKTIYQTIQWLKSSDRGLAKEKRVCTLLPEPETEKQSKSVKPEKRASPQKTVKKPKPPTRQPIATDQVHVTIDAPVSVIADLIENAPSDTALTIQPV